MREQGKDPNDVDFMTSEDLDSSVHSTKESTPPPPLQPVESTEERTAADGVDSEMTVEQMEIEKSEEKTEDVVDGDATNDDDAVAPVDEMVR